MTLEPPTYLETIAEFEQVRENMFEGVKDFNPENIGDLSGRIAIVTGGHSGLGLHTARNLALAGAKVYIFSRASSKAKVTEAMRWIEHENGVKAGKGRVKWIECDLGDLGSVRRAVEGQEKSLHLLINNAGIMCPPDSANNNPSLDIQWTTNYLSHFLLASILLPTLLHTASLPTTVIGSVRIINVASDAASKLAPKQGILFDELEKDGGKGVGKWTMYGMSKLAMVLHAREVARRCGERGVQGGCVHPGTVRTGLSAGPLASTPFYRLILPLIELGAPGPEKGCWNTLWCATSPELGLSEKDGNGGFFVPVGKKGKGSVWGDDEEMCRKLWEWSEEYLRGRGLLEGTEEI
ncbi:retinol dehydrogenase [Halenospora varia]|nr:retinol dehydrogenase [Halenospora varia]